MKLLTTGTEISIGTDLSNDIYLDPSKLNISNQGTGLKLELMRSIIPSGGSKYQARELDGKSNRAFKFGFVDFEKEPSDMGGSYSTQVHEKNYIQVGGIKFRLDPNLEEQRKTDSRIKRMNQAPIKRIEGIEFNTLPDHFKKAMDILIHANLKSLVKANSSPDDFFSCAEDQPPVISMPKNYNDVLKHFDENPSYKEGYLNFIKESLGISNLELDTETEQKLIDLYTISHEFGHAHDAMNTERNEESYRLYRPQYGGTKTTQFRNKEHELGLSSDQSKRQDLKDPLKNV